MRTLITAASHDTRLTVDFAREIEVGLSEMAPAGYTWQYSQSGSGALEERPDLLMRGDDTGISQAKSTDFNGLLMRGDDTGISQAKSTDCDLPTKEDGARFSAPTQPIGGAALHHWLFVPTQAGVVTLTFVHQRHWDPLSTPHQMVVVDIEILPPTR